MSASFVRPARTPLPLRILLVLALVALALLVMWPIALASAVVWEGALAVVGIVAIQHGASFAADVFAICTRNAMVMSGIIIILVGLSLPRASTGRIRQMTAREVGWLGLHPVAGMIVLLVPLTIIVAYLNWDQHGVDTLAGTMLLSCLGLFAVLGPLWLLVAPGRAVPVAYRWARRTSLRAGMVVMTSSLVFLVVWTVRPVGEARKAQAAVLRPMVTIVERVSVGRGVQGRATLALATLKKMFADLPAGHEAVAFRDRR